MAYVAVDEDGREFIYERQPKRMRLTFWGGEYAQIQLPKGSIEKLIGRTLTWDDDPVRLK